MHQRLHALLCYIHPVLFPTHCQCHNAVLEKLPKLTWCSSSMLSETAEPGVYVHADMCAQSSLVMMCAAMRGRGQKG